MGADRTGRPTVSIVIPCHGQAHFLPDAIESALCQSGAATEVVVVDDGSPDHTADVARSYGGVHLVQTANLGLGSARNTGLEVSAGEHVVFLDADDRLRPGAVEAGLAAFRDRPDAAFVVGAHALVDENGRVLVDRKQEVASGDPYGALLRGNFIAMHGAVLYRRQAVVDVGAFDVALPACEDYDLYLRMARTEPIHQHGAVVAEYRMHPRNMSNDTALMLATVLGVLQRQLVHVRGDEDLERSYRHGVVAWTTYYRAEMLGRWPEVQDLFDAGPDPDVLSHALAVARDTIGRGRRLVRHLRSRSRSTAVPALGQVEMGHLRRVQPISEQFGFDRGRPVDRYYIERFLEANAGDVRGRVLEVGDSAYTHRFGGARVARADVLHVSDRNAQATFVGSLEDGAGLPSAAFDCIILTQTLHLVYDLHAALRTVARVLRPGGVLLATVPGISQVDPAEWGATWSWGIMPHALERLAAEAFPSSDVRIESCGNVLASAAFLYGLAVEELTTAELDHRDPSYPMVSTLRVVVRGDAP